VTVTVPDTHGGVAATYRVVRDGATGEAAVVEGHGVDEVTVRQI
jgi:hypothetical protein